MQQIVLVLLNTSLWCVYASAHVWQSGVLYILRKTAAASNDQQNAWAEERRIRRRAQWTIIEKSTSKLTDYNSNKRSIFGRYMTAALVLENMQRNIA